MRGGVWEVLITPGKKIATVDDLRSAIAKSLNGRQCVQSWVGYGSAIFIGFGDDVIPPPLPDDRHPMPHYELQTSFADWQVEGPTGIIGTSDDEHDTMTKAVEMLVRHKVLEWQLDTVSLTLLALLEGGLRLQVTPYSDDEFPSAESWWLVLADDNKVIGANSDLTIYEDIYHYLTDNQ